MFPGKEVFEDPLRTWCSTRMSKNQWIFGLGRLRTLGFLVLQRRSPDHAAVELLYYYYCYYLCSISLLLLSFWGRFEWNPRLKENKGRLCPTPFPGPNLQWCMSLFLEGFTLKFDYPQCLFLFMAHGTSADNSCAIPSTMVSTNPLLDDVHGSVSVQVINIAVVLVRSCSTPGEFAGGWSREDLDQCSVSFAWEPCFPKKGSPLLWGLGRWSPNEPLFSP